MTDVRELLGSALLQEPPATVDPHAAVAAGRQRRTRRRRWLAAGAAAAVVLGIGGVVGLPRMGSTGADGIAPGDGPTVGPSGNSTVLLEWVSTPPTQGSGFDLDVQRTRENLAGAAARIQQQLEMVAVAPATLYVLDHDDLGALQLAYRTADGDEVHVVIEGSATATAAASCIADPPVPELPKAWPDPTRGERPRGSKICVPGPLVRTTRPAPDRLDRTVAADVEPLYRGAVSVTVTSDAQSPPPATVAAVAAVVDQLRSLVVFADAPDD